MAVGYGIEPGETAPGRVLLVATAGEDGQPGLVLRSLEVPDTPEGLEDEE